MFVECSGIVMYVASLSPRSVFHISIDSDYYLSLLSLDRNKLGKEGTVALTGALQECKQLQVLR